jgi:hypothetical protein
MELTEVDNKESVYRAKKLVIKYGGDINVLFDQPDKIRFPRARDDVQVIHNVGVAEDHEVDLCLMNDNIVVRKTGQLDTTANELVTPFA